MTNPRKPRGDSSAAGQPAGSHADNQYGISASSNVPQDGPGELDGPVGEGENHRQDTEQPPQIPETPDIPDIPEQTTFAPPTEPVKLIDASHSKRFRRKIWQRGFLAGFVSAVVVASVAVVSWQASRSFLPGVKDEPEERAAPASSTTDGADGGEDSSEAETATGTSESEPAVLTEVPREPKTLEHRSFDRPDYADIPEYAVPGNEKAQNNEVGDFAAIWQGTIGTPNEFARMVQAEYVANLDRTGALNTEISAYNPLTKIYYSLNCWDEGSYVTCIGGNNAVIYIA